MKKLILFLICIGLVGTVYADTIDVYSFYAYSGNNQISSDWTDDTLVIQQGSDLQLQTRFENTYNISVPLTMHAVLALSNDKVIDKPVTLDPNSKKLIVMSFTIPSDEKKGIYPLDIYYTYNQPAWDANGNINYTSYRKDKSFDVQLDTYTQSSNDVIQNLTIQLTNAQANQDKLNSLIANYSNLNTQYSSCQTEFGICKNNITFLADYKTKYEAENSDYMLKTSTLATCQAQVATMHDESYVKQQVTDAENKARTAQSGSDNVMTGIVVIAAIAYIVYDKKKKKVGDDQGKDPIRKGEATFSTGTVWQRK